MEPTHPAGRDGDSALSSVPSFSHYAATPAFNTKAVVRETVVPADTFRAWERRYGIPCPQRTAGGHRLYSERDMAVIRWLRDRTAGGMNISQAIQQLAAALDCQCGASAPALVDAPQPMAHMATQLADLLTRFDSAGAERLLSEAFAMHPLEDVLVSLVQPALVDVGERWHRHEINVATEHFASQFIRRKLSGLLGLFDRQAGQSRAVVACAPSELHDLGALVVALFLARRGWSVIYLGAQVPMADLEATVATLRPTIVCLSASMPETAAQVADVASALRRSHPGVLIGFGGRVFNDAPALRDSIPGIFLGADARELVAILGQRLQATSTGGL
ncbi:MerR family transcriptional regulator [Chloroflexia bacterium SDU3-3]|nr:MerR family transcriptional regulator [Chloroflexia bacterium SDU3-3]